jgi:hypothetical protein
MPDRFTRDTAVERTGPDRFRAYLSEGWLVMDDSALNGGYLMATCARAMVVVAERPHPVTITGHFMRRPAVGPAEIRTQVLKGHGRHQTVSAALFQDNAECLRVTGTFADLALADGPMLVRRRPPELPRHASLPPADLSNDGRTPEIYRRLDIRMPQGQTRWTHGEPDGSGEFSGYTGWSDTDRVDVLGLLVLADAYPPVVFNVESGFAAWAPTIELTLQIRGVPALGPLRARFETRSVTNGYFEEDGELWDSEGRLVALSRQLAMVGRGS